MNTENVSLHRTYYGKSRHDFLTEVVEIVMRFDWKAEGIDPQDARSHIYLSLIDWLNTRHDLHDGEKEHFQAKGIAIMQGRVIRGEYVASFKSDAHKKPDNKVMKQMLKTALDTDEPSDTDKAVLGAYNELGKNYRELIDTVVIQGQPNPRNRQRLSEGLTKLSHKTDLKLSKHVYSLDGFLESTGDSGYARRDDLTEDDVWWSSSTNYLSEFSVDDELDLTHASWEDAVRDLYEDATFIDDSFVDLAYDKVVEEHGITAHLYVWMNGQACPDPDLKEAWEHLDEDERYAIYVRYTNTFSVPNTSGIVIDSKVKQAHHEESMKAENRLAQIWESIKSGIWPVQEEVTEMPLESPQINPGPLLEPELPPVLVEALQDISAPLDALEEFLELGWTADERFLPIWNSLDYVDQKALTIDTTHDAVRTQTYWAQMKEQATDNYIKLWKESDLGA